MKGRGDQAVSVLAIPTVRRHSPSTNPRLIMAALDGGALTPSKGEGIICEISNALVRKEFPIRALGSCPRMGTMP